MGERIEGEHSIGASHSAFVADDPLFSGGDGDQRVDERPIEIVPVVSEICARLHALQKRRNYNMDQRMASLTRLGAFIRLNFLDWSPDLSAEESLTLCKRAAAIIKAVDAGTSGGKDKDIVTDARLEIATTLISVESFRSQQTAIEKEMRKQAQLLPVWPWAEEVKGFGALDFAKIIGEAGDLSRFATHQRLWKRMGLAVINGGRQRKVKGKAALEHGYNAKRRAVSWNMAQNLFKHQWRGEKDGEPAHPIGPYGEKYARKKAEYLERVEATASLPDKVGEHWNPAKWTKKRADNAARRYMEKELLRDLWQEWRRRSGPDGPWRHSACEPLVFCPPDGAMQVAAE